MPGRILRLNFSHGGRYLTKTLLIMKITAILLLATCLQVSARGFSQTVTLSMKNVPVQKIFTEISRQTDVSIIYDEKLFEHFSLLNIDVKRATIQQVLDQCLKNQPFVYRIENNIISIKDTASARTDQTERLVSTVIRGKVTDERGEPLIGATVALKNSGVTTTTDSLGNFELSVNDPVRDVLVVSFVSYGTEDIPIRGRNSVIVKLSPDAKALTDVIMVGYGTQRKRDVTGATATVKAEEIAKRPLVRVEQALQGTVAGVNVQSSSGQPGNSISVRIRGANSISGTNEPLYVIDGFIGGNIESIAMADIESLEILKDASSTAIYGSRGSNGVVLITTKMGKEGKPRVDFNPWFSKAEIPKKLKLMNAYEFASMVNARDSDLGNALSFTQAQLDGFKTNPGTDWQQEIRRKPWIQNYQLSVSGGSPGVKYLFSFNYLDQPGLILNQYYKRATFRSNIDARISDRLNLKVYLSVVMPKNRNTSYAGDITDPFAQAYEWDPTSPVRDAAGNFILQSSYASLGINPVAQSTNQLEDGNSTYIAGTGVLTYKIIKGLTFTSNTTYDRNSYYNPSLRGPGTSNYIQNTDYAQVVSGRSWSWQSSNFLTYSNRFGDHSLTVTALYERKQYEGMSTTARATNLSSYANGYYNLGLGASQQTSSSYGADALQSYMGRVNYSYKDKYLLTASVRSDGSSHLIDKYSTFPSVGLGWVVSKEDFMSRSNVFSDLKIRATYGVTGNQAVPAYATIRQTRTGPQGPWGGTPGYYFDGSALTIATLQGGPVSSSLKWERNTAVDVGIDAAFLRGRLLFSVDAYRKKITDLLYNYQAPFYNSGESYIRNLGSLENKGIEFAIGGTPVAGPKLRWNVNFTLSFNRNKVLNLGGLDSVVLGNVGSAQTNHSILMVGRALGNFYGYQYLGTWKTKEAGQAAAFGEKPGDARYTDVNGDNKYTSADMMVIGNGNPDYSFGFINDISYGNFTLSFMFQGTHGNKIYSGTFPYTFGDQGDARHATNRDVLNRWTPEHETDIPAFSKSAQNFVNSSRWVYDGSYIKLKNLSIGYQIPQQLLNRVKMRSLEIYVSGQNLFVINHYPGYDPEVTNANYGQYPSIAQGLETGVIPNPRTYTFGLRAGF